MSLSYKITSNLAMICIMVFAAILIQSCSKHNNAENDKVLPTKNENVDQINVQAELENQNGEQSIEDINDWCPEHAVPESKCTQCDPTLIAQYKESGDWCAGHDLPESHCRLCNPGIEFPQERLIAQSDDFSGETSDQAFDDWCAEHAVPESQCTQCNPSLITHYKESGDWCAGHDLPESHCRLCNPGIEFPQERLIAQSAPSEMEKQIEVSLPLETNSEICATNGSLIQFLSTSTVKKVGISTQQINTGIMETAIEAPAEVVFDESKCNVITSTVSALVSKWIISPGESVYYGDALAVMQSPEIAELEAELLKAEAAYRVQEKALDRHKELKKKNLISEIDYESQEALTEQTLADLSSIKGLLLSAGLNNDDLSEIIKSKKVSNQYLIRSGSDGVVVRRLAQIGDLMQAGQAFALLADPKAMWIEASLTEKQIRHVKIGQNLTFSSDGDGLIRVGAKVIWISKYLDMHSRTGIVRAEVIDTSVNLQAGEFGLVSIWENQNTQILLVHRDAVQWEGCCNVVFVKESEMRFRPQKINILGRNDDYYQIEGNVNAGDDVVVNGSFLLKTELKKSSIGAGCCDFEPAG
jgi:membrane fusion protein, heavy metal efflux system